MEEPPPPPPPPPHVLVFPLPFQGPVNSMLKVAELLCLAGIQVTFLVTDFIHSRLLRHTNIKSHFSSYTNFTIASISDGLPEDHPRLRDQLVEMFDAWESVTKQLFKERLICRKLGSDAWGPVTCIIADGILGFTIDVAQETGIPIICSRTISPCFFLTVLSLGDLIESGELPFTDNDLDALVTGVPGMENHLRRRDLPSFCRNADISGPDFQLYLKERKQCPRANGLILNSFEELEGPILSHIGKICPNIYTIGPLHALLKSNLKEANSTSSPSSLYSSSFRQEDRSCLTWLDKQSSKSVVYVSFGSLVTLTWDQVIEFWYGLVNSGARFLWVRRTDAISDSGWEGRVPVELQQGTNKRGYIVSWAPQDEVLAHPSIGAFLTHSGWNSTIESIFEGVPMICWPFFADQQVNSRFVGDVWKLGSDMKDTCDRVIIEKSIKDMMETKREAFRSSADRMANLAKQSVSRGGSSYGNLNRMIHDISTMSFPSRPLNSF